MHSVLGFWENEVALGFLIDLEKATPVSKLKRVHCQPIVASDRCIDFGVSKRIEKTLSTWSTAQFNTMSIRYIISGGRYFHCRASKEAKNAAFGGWRSKLSSLAFMSKAYALPYVSCSGYIIALRHVGIFIEAHCILHSTWTCLLIDGWLGKRKSHHVILGIQSWVGASEARTARRAEAEEADRSRARKQLTAGELRSRQRRLHISSIYIHITPFFWAS